MTELETIPVNIRDDFYDDDFVPEGKIQETYAYVEEYDEISEDEKSGILKLIEEYISKNVELEGVEIKTIFHDTKDDYDEETVKKCTEVFGENFFFKRWEITFKHLTHEKLAFLLEKLENSGLEFGGKKIDFYSES